MFEYENEVADEATSSEAVDSTESVETSDVSESVEVSADSESIDTGETAADALEEAPQVLDWNGELESIQQEQWFSDLDDAVRDVVQRGMTAKYRNYERGYTKAFQEAALKRRALENREKEIRDTELRVQKWLHGDVDPMAEKQRELELLRANHTAALEALRKEHEQSVLKQQTEHASSIDELIAAREAAEERSRQLEQLEAQREQAALDAEVDNFEQWIQAEADHVYNDKDALYALCVQVASGIPKEDALRMVLAGYPAPEPEVTEPEPATPEPVPEAVEMMNMGASPAANTTEQTDLNFDERMDLLRRQYMQEAADLHKA
tara:strand:- start:1153 stop:2118 length:966 start_codon:yes stop_codon:yes gene_type:complete